MARLYARKKKKGSLCYPFYLAITSDAVAVTTEDKKLVKILRQGKDTTGLHCQFDTENDFLDTINVVLKAIDSKEDAKQLILNL